MNSITHGQLTSLLIITDIFALVCFEGSLSALAAPGFAAGVLVQAAAAFPFMKAVEKGWEFPKALKVLFAVSLIFWSAVLLRRLWNAADVTFIPYETSGGIGGKLIITAFIATVCLYVSSTGIKAAARSAVIVAFMGALFILTDFISALKPENFGNISACAGQSTFMDGLVLSLETGGSTVTFTVLLPLVKNSGKRALIRYFSCRTLVCTAIIAVTVLVTGGIMKIMEFPVIAAAQLSQPFSSQRIDSLFLIIFAVFGVFALTAQIMAAAYLAREVFPKFRRWRSTSMIALTALTAVFMGGAA